MLKNALSRTLAGVALCATSVVSLPAHAGKTLDTIKSRGQLVCGVNVALAGFSAADSEGKWSGMDVDYCKALAAAMSGRCQQGEIRAVECATTFHRAAIRRNRHLVT